MDHIASEQGQIVLYTEKNWSYSGEKHYVSIHVFIERKHSRLFWVYGVGKPQ